MNLALALAVPLCFPAGSATQEEASPPRSIPLLSHADLSARIAALAAGHPDLVTTLRLGASREGRSIEALRLSTSSEEGRPAILLVANLDGPRVFASAVALDHARRLAQGYGSDEGITRLLDTTTVLVVPRANPDAAEARFQEPLFERVAGGRGVDDDRDGRLGEDPPSDVDGDGRITAMRVLDPAGEWIEDPTDPRVLVRADASKGERGRFELHVEGRDLDGDERVAEDPPADTRLNRNFPSGWREHAADAGLFPSDEPEARALMELVLAHGEIALVVTYDELDDLVEKPESVADDAKPKMRVPPAGMLESDAALLAILGERYRELTGSEAKGAASDEGTFQRWCYDHRGLLCLNAVLWEMPRSEPPEGDEDGEAGEDGGDVGRGKEEKPSDDARRLAWIDASGEDWRFVPWTAFEHPELGAVEIGGFAPFALVEPPEADRAAIADSHLEFLVGLADDLARVRIAECTARSLGAGVWRVEAVLENAALLPLQTRSARRTRTLRPARVRLVLPEAGRLLAGQVRTLIDDLPGRGGREELDWLVAGPEGMEIGVSVDTTNAGTNRRIAEVAR